jgi:hypothetical protein
MLGRALYTCRIFMDEMKCAKCGSAMKCEGCGEMNPKMDHACPKEGIKCTACGASAAEGSSEAAM